MTDLQIYLTLGIFAAVILIIALDLLDMTVAALIGVCAMLAFGILDTGGITSAMRIAGGPLALLFGGMVVARMLGRTGVFEHIGAMYLHACAGSGRRGRSLIHRKPPVAQGMGRKSAWCGRPHRGRHRLSARVGTVNRRGRCRESLFSGRR